MNNKVLKKLSAKKMYLAPVDNETAKRLKKISAATGQEGWAVINVALQILEKSLGRKVIVRSADTNTDMVINHFRGFQSVSDLTFD